VTAVCSEANADLVRSLGADHVVDYKTEDFRVGGRRYDVIMDNQGNVSYAQVGDSLAPDGRFLMVYGDLGQTIASAWRKAVVSGTASSTGDRLRALISLAEQGVLEPVIGSVVPFGQIADAHRRVDSGHKVGSLVLAVDQAN
jgi:NADPH:quinone reductase-like Zn-dependent oxidoreductase